MLNVAKGLPALSCLLFVAGAALSQDGAQDGAELGNRVTLGGGEAVTACYQAARRGAATEAAVRVCTRAIETATRPINRTASTVNRGVIHFGAAEYELAIADFTTAIDDYGTRNPRVFVNRGLAFEQVRPGDPAFEARARADYEAALSISPENATAKRRLDALGRPFLERRPPTGRTVT